MKLDPTSRAAGLAFLVAGVTLSTQILVHRLVSAKLLNNYAFLVISLTMLGFAFSGIVLTRWRRPLLDDLGDALSACSALFALTLLASIFLFCSARSDAPFGFNRPSFVIAFLRWLPWSLLFAAPFACTGLMLSTLLAAPRFSPSRVYFYDLVGSALGALTVIPLIGYLGLEAATLAGAAALLGGTLLLAPPRRAWVRVLALGAGVALALSVPYRSKLFEIYYPDGSILAATRSPQSGTVLEYFAWDPIARIEVSRIQPPHPDAGPFGCLIGTNRAFHARFRRMLTQNNYAYTYAVDYDGHRESLSGIEETVYAAAYQAAAVPAPKVLVIGVGGGFDILNGLHFGASKITGVEVNAATVRILKDTYRDYFHHWIDDPRVQVVFGEGRHFLASAPERYDVIQLSGVDSYSGTAAAAHVFSENYLYTEEAFDLYLSRLTDQGILNVMRLEFNPPREMLRALTTAVGALRRAGVENPARHLVLLSATSGNFTTLLMKRTPFNVEEVGRLEAWAATSPYFAVAAAPGRTAPPANMYETFLTLGDPAKERAFVTAYPFDVSPTDDDRPFFFKYSFWWHLFPASPMIWGNVPVMEYSILMLVFVVSVTSIASIYVPLRFLSREGREVTGRRWLIVYFAGAGIGYMAAEVALLQAFGLFLGHPNYALSVVLAALLLATGVGSLLSARIVAALGGVRFASYALAAVLLAIYGGALPLLPSLLGQPFAVRVALVFALVSPIGLLLGVFVPAALERLRITDPAFIPWAWGISGIFSVMAPIVAVAFSMTWGIRALLLSSIPIYMVVGWSFPTSDAKENPLSQGPSPLAPEGASAA